MREGLGGKWVLNNLVTRIQVEDDIAQNRRTMRHVARQPAIDATTMGGQQVGDTEYPSESRNGDYASAH